MEQQFEHELQQHVPARGLTGASPRRTLSVDVTIPAGHSVKREAAPEQHGALVVHKNLGGLDEVSLVISEIPSGVHIEWELKNPESFPVGGRTAILKVALIGVGAGGEDQPVVRGFSPTYEAIRQRFFADFFYDGLVAERIEGSSSKFGDQTIYMGQALIWLATEAHLRQRLGQDATDTQRAIGQILAAVDQLDLDAEPLFGHPPALDGFISRDNITGVADPRLGGRFQEAQSDWQNPENAAPSGDQVFGLLYGLWFVVRLVQDDALIARVRELSDRIFVHVKDARFVLKLPDGKEVKRGGDLRWLSSLLHGLNQHITGRDRFDECRIEVFGLPVKLNAVAAFWEGAGGQAAQLLRSEIEMPGLGKQSINSFAAHILLMALAPSGVWSKQEFERAALAVNHHLSVLFYSLAHDSKPDLFGYADIAAILDRCPSDGPRSDLPIETGWQQDNRWIRCSNIDEPGEGNKLYNGVDFMMLHNLAVLVFAA
jgi:hypothetical protein